MLDFLQDFRARNEQPGTELASVFSGEAPKPSVDAHNLVNPYGLWDFYEVEITNITRTI